MFAVESPFHHHQFFKIWVGFDSIELWSSKWLAFQNLIFFLFAMTNSFHGVWKEFKKKRILLTMYVRMKSVSKMLPLFEIGLVSLLLCCCCCCCCCLCLCISVAWELWGTNPPRSRKIPKEWPKVAWKTPSFLTGSRRIPKDRSEIACSALKSRFDTKDPRGY